MKTAVVTGANRGLGAGFAEYLATQGITTYAAMRSTKEYVTPHAKIIPVVLDITNDASIKNLAKRIKDDGKTIDLLINNAGTNAHSGTGGHRELVNKLESIDRASINQMFDTNATSALIIIKELHSLLAPNALILNVSSDRASYHDEFTNSSANYGYRASKIALNMFSFVLPTDLRSDIRVTAVHPGDIQTDMNPEGVTKPNDAAKEVFENIVAGWRPEFKGAFVRFSGELYPL